MIYHSILIYHISRRKIYTYERIIMNFIFIISNKINEWQFIVVNNFESIFNED